MSQEEEDGDEKLTSFSPFSIDLIKILIIFFIKFVALQIHHFLILLAIFFALFKFIQDLLI